MPTIAKTKRYRELSYRHLKLVQLYSVMSELRLHTNKAVSTDTSKYDHSILYVWDDYAPFLTASLESMMQVFYIELDGFIGGFWDVRQRRVRPRDNEQGSLAAYLYDGTRTTRKKAAQVAFETLLQQSAADLEMIRNLRYKLAHFKKLNERNNALAPGDIKIREILNKLAEILYLLGFQRWNTPHYIEQDNSPSASTQKVIDKLVATNDKASDMRKAYMEARNKWFGYVGTKR
jgi:hypothetical protein